MTDCKTSERIAEELLDRLIGDADPTELFQSSELIGELKRKLPERIVDAKMDVHLAQDQVSENVRNGHNKKTVLTDSGSIPLEVPRDRQGTFEPQLVEKYFRRLPDFDEKVTQLFAYGMTTRRRQAAARELYGMEVSADLMARVTDVVMKEFTE